MSPVPPQLPRRSLSPPADPNILPRFPGQSKQSQNSSLFGFATMPRNFGQKSHEPLRLGMVCLSVNLFICVSVLLFCLSVCTCLKNTNCVLTSHWLSNKARLQSSQDSLRSMTLTLDLWSRIETIFLQYPRKSDSCDLPSAFLDLFVWPVCLSLCVCPSVSLSVFCLCVCLSIFGLLSVCLSIYVCMYVCV